MNFCPDFAINSRKNDVCRFINQICENKLENSKLPKILKSVKIIQYCSYSYFFICVLGPAGRRLTSSSRSATRTAAACREIKAWPSTCCRRRRRRVPKGVPRTYDVTIDYACEWQTLQGSFSAVSKPNFASKYAFESSRRDLHNALLRTALQSQPSVKICQLFAEK